MVLVALLALGAASFFGASNILIRRGLDGSNPHAGMVFSLLSNVVILWVVFFAFVPLSFLLSLKAVIIFCIAGLLAPGLARMLRYTSLEKIGVARTGPIAASSPIISTSIAVLFLGEQLTVPIIAGTFLIIVGVIIASRKEFVVNRNDMLFAVGAAILGGISFPIRKYGLSLLDSPITAGVVTASIGMALALIIIAIGGNLGKVSFKDSGLKFYLFAGACSSAAFILNFAALSAGDVAVVGPLIQTTPLFSLILSYLFINHLEKVNRQIWFGTIVSVVGVVLIGAS